MAHRPARDVYRLLIDPPEVPSAAKLRHRRLQAGITITTAARALRTHTARISELERGLHHDRYLAERYQRHLAQLAS